MKTPDATERGPTERQIANWLAVLIGDESPIELRAPKTTTPGHDKPRNVVRRFRPGAFAEAAREALKLSGRAPGIYFAMNSLAPALLDAPAGRGATDADVTRRRWLLVDCDPTRPADKSATRAEKASALKTMLAVREHLRALNWPAPVVGDSGNGFHLLYRIDLPADDGGLVKRVLESLAHRFDSEACTIDKKVFNPSRICKLYGSLSAKGPHTDDRPHRLSRLMKIPAGGTEVAAVELLQTVAADRPALDLADEIERKRERAEVASPPPNGKPRSQGNRPDAESRAVKYLARCEPSISGSGGHDACLKAAIAVGPGFDLPPEVAFRLLASEFNGRCVPEWSEPELRHKIAEAYKVEMKRGWLLDADRNGAAPSNNGQSGKANPPTSGPPSDGPEPARPRPRVVITSELHEVVAEAVAALALDPHVYQRGSSLVRVVRDAKAPKSLAGADGTPVIVGVTTHHLLELMSRSAEWRRWGQDRSGAAALVPAAPKDEFARMISDRCHWPGVRPLEGIIEAPTLRLDGSVLQTPGYDRDTGLFFLPNEQFPVIPERPGKADAAEAAARLVALVADFPFESEPHAFAWLACCVTDVVRFGIDGPTPIFLFDANTSGAGKTILCDLAAVIATGRGMPRSSYTSNDVEMAKQLLAIALGGFRFILFDNLQTGEDLGGAALDKAMTSKFLNDRLLGSSKMSGDVPFYAVIHATGNNLGLKGDALRRVVPCRLESPEDRPEERSDFKVKGSLLDHARANRAALVADALTIVRAFVVAGRPAQGLTPMGSFERWSDLVRGAIHWASGVDPCATRKGRIADDDATAELAGLIAAWEALCRDAGKDAMTAAGALQFLESRAGGNPELRAILSEWSKDGKLPTTRVMGKRLSRVKGKSSGGKAFQFATLDGNREWYVRPVRRPSSVSGGESGSPHNPVYEKSNDKCSGVITWASANQSPLSPQSHLADPHAASTWTAEGFEAVPF